MIKINNLSKTFGKFTALDSVSCEIPNGCIYGMVGSNGAGKSTFLRVLTGVYKNNFGTVEYDGEKVYENPAVKGKIVFVPDDLFFLPGASLLRMARLYRNVYPNFDNERFNTLVKQFKISPKKAISGFSKGMKRQAATILALSAKPDYLFFDETFDGLDPVMRNFVKTLIYDDVSERGITTIITSHSLRELEDICDSLVLLHEGKVILKSDVSDIKTSSYKIQVAFDFEYDKSLFEELDVISFIKTGSVSNLIVKCDEHAARELITKKNPILFDILPLTLEEVFTVQMKELGYEFTSVLGEEKNEKYNF